MIGNCSPIVTQLKCDYMQNPAIIGLMLGLFFGFILFGVLLSIYRPPAFVIDWCQRRWPDVIWQVATKRRVVALTIDDGPSEYTEEIAAILKDNEATATFFVIGSHISGRTNVLRKLVEQGHELGNHAMHDEPSRSLSLRELRSQIQTVDAQIDQIYGSCQQATPVRYFRPGSGFFNSGMRNMVTDLGHHLVLGGIYPHDPQIPFWRLNSWHILSLLRPGAIIICHDGRAWTPPMLRKVLPHIRACGYRVVSVSELVGSTDELGRSSKSRG